MIYFIADTHFDDKNIIPFANRPFLDIQEMNEHIIIRWNRVVQPDDIVYVLGDFAHISSDMKNILEHLNGTKYLIRGNHDTCDNAFYREMGFAEVYDKPIILDDFWILSHEPLFMNDSMPYVNIFGHVHNNPIYADYSKQHFCACVEREKVSYTPISFIDVKAFIQEKYLEQQNDAE